MDYILSAENLTRTFSRGKIRALQDVTLKIEPGKVFGLLGPNGAGKTTFVKILLNLMRPSSGSARLFDLPVNNPQARARIGYLPENHRFPEFLTGAALLDYCGRLCKLDQAKRVERAELLLKLVKMWEWRDTRTRKYSKGMMQRLGIAQAMLHNPELIFLDEPTDGVDPIGRKEIREVLIELKQQGKTIFINSHLLSEVEMVCDEVAILHRGKLIKQGAVKDLTATELRYRVHANVKEPALLQDISSRVMHAEAQNGHLDLTVASSQALNDVIDVLRQSQILIEAIVPQRQTLEESFMQSIALAGTTDLDHIMSDAATGREEAPR